MYYPKKIVAGIKHAKHVFHGNLIAHIVIATLKGKSTNMLTTLLIVSSVCNCNTTYVQGPR